MANNHRKIARFLAGLKQQAEFKAEQERKERAEYERTHPVSSGVIPFVAYVAPRGSYSRR